MAPLPVDPGIERLIPLARHAKYGSIGSSLAEQCRSHRGPLILQRAGPDWLTGGPVPVAGIGQIAFDAMQVGMHPGGLAALIVLHDLVCLVPVTLGGPPQGL